ncbi:hypothetical protein ACFQ51_55005 [Streptomyces kaempferi]
MREICIPLNIDPGIDAFANLERFALRAAKVVDTYREMMTDLPREIDLSAEEVMAVMASTPVRRILERSADQISLKTAIVQRHNLLSQARPVTERNIDAIASRLAQRAGSDDCVDLAESFLGRLFPMGIRTPAVRDDLSTGTDRVEDRLVPGAPWSQVAELVQVFHALTQDDGQPRLAVLLQQRDKGIGHVLVYARVRNPDNDEWKILRVDPQESSAPVREVTAQFPAVTDLASPPTTTDPRSRRTGNGSMQAAAHAWSSSTTPDAPSTPPHSPTTSSNPNPPATHNHNWTPPPATATEPSAGKRNSTRYPSAPQATQPCQTALSWRKTPETVKRL